MNSMAEMLGAQLPKRPYLGARSVDQQSCGEIWWAAWPKTLKQTSREAKVLLCAPALDHHLQEMAELANPGVLHLQ